MRSRCRIVGCKDKKLIAKGMCYPHYNRARGIRKKHGLSWAEMLESKRWLAVIRPVVKNKRQRSERELGFNVPFLAEAVASCALDGETQSAEPIKDGVHGYNIAELLAEVSALKRDREKLDAKLDELRVKLVAAVEEAAS